MAETLVERLRRLAREKLIAANDTLKGIQQRSAEHDVRVATGQVQPGLVDRAGIKVNDLQNQAYKKIEATEMAKAMEVIRQKEANDAAMQARFDQIHTWMPQPLQDTRWDPTYSRPAPQPPVQDVGEIAPEEEGVGERHPDEEKPTKYQAAVDKIKKK